MESIPVASLEVSELNNKKVIKEESSPYFDDNKFIEYLKYLYETIDENEPPEKLPFEVAQVKKLTPKEQKSLDRSLQTLYKYRNNPEFQKIPLPIEYYIKYEPSNPILEKYIYAEKLRNAKTRKEQIKITIDHYEKPELFD
jgi:hypothetical protein